MVTKRRNIFIAILLVVSSAGFFLSQEMFGVAERRVINVDGIERSYVVYAPKSDAGSKQPVVIVLHGGGESAEYMINATGWSDKAQEENFIVVFPEGTRPNPAIPAELQTNQQTWADGADRFYHHTERGVDDVAFIDALLDEVIVLFNADEKKIFVTGFSNGASMTLRLGVELSDRIAAIGPVAGGLWSHNLKLERSVSLIYISGTADPLPTEIEVAFGDTTKKIEAPHQDIGEIWARMLSCSKRTAENSTSKNTTLLAWSDCKDGSRVHTYTIEGLGHVWPRKGDMLETSSGVLKSKFEATDAIWEFFDTM